MNSLNSFYEPAQDFLPIFEGIFVERDYLYLDPGCRLGKSKNSGESGTERFFIEARQGAYRLSRVEWEILEHCASAPITPNEILESISKKFRLSAGNPNVEGDLQGFIKRALEEGWLVVG